MEPTKNSRKLRAMHNMLGFMSRLRLCSQQFSYYYYYDTNPVGEVPLGNWTMKFFDNTF